jgi:hypothetical protein
MKIFALILFFLALIAAILGIFSVPLAHLEFWAIAFLAAAFIVERLSGYVVTTTPRP